MDARRTMMGLALAATALGAACSSQPAPAERAVEAPKPAVTAEQQAQKYRDCWEAFNTKNWAALGGCYAPSAQVEAIDSGRPVVSGVEAAVKDSQEFTAAFPDVAGRVQLVVAGPNSVAGLAVVTGTHGGPLPGPDGKPIAPTNKAIAYTMGIVLDFDGLAVLRERQYADSTTMLAQLGVIKAPARPVSAPALAAPTVAVSTGSDSERANVETFRANIAAFNAHDPKALAAMNTADAVFHDYTQTKDMDGAGNAALLTQLFKGFPDATIAATSIWGAGDYVVTEGTFSGTNKAAVPEMGIAKATGKAVKVRMLEITKIENGKIKEDWLVFDSLAFATQLGL